MLIRTRAENAQRKARKKKQNVVKRGEKKKGKRIVFPPHGLAAAEFLSSYYRPQMNWREAGWNASMEALAFN